ncbi:zf-TFIIB domain-containing protein [Leifsonia sp. NPDC058230]|uniref:TFIIB-type zinc ribbon-containing protein n=1 Tax=Leifsonia sp. NPDC058230 TaxID=3346391 RepID=UPI0036D8CFF7
MKCPTDNATLVMSERNGIEIDYCPECRGVWLDRGELDKIIDRSPNGALPAQPQYAAPAQQPQYPAQQPYSAQQQHSGQQPYRKKKENWLSELFD